jgi:osmotically inducible protein OsmC
MPLPRCIWSDWQRARCDESLTSRTLHFDGKIAMTDKVLYTAKTHTIGGREKGVARSSDGHLDIRLSPPGTGGTGTNPEQLFAAGWSACFEGALGIVAGKAKVKLPEETSVDAEVDLLYGTDGFSLRARLNVNLPGLDHAVAEDLIEAAHHTCPYSKAIHGNVDVVTNLVV